MLLLNTQILQIQASLTCPEAHPAPTTSHPTHPSTYLHGWPAADVVLSPQDGLWAHVVQGAHLALPRNGGCVCQGRWRIGGWGSAAGCEVGCGRRAGGGGRALRCESQCCRHPSVPAAALPDIRSLLNHQQLISIAHTHRRAHATDIHPSTAALPLLNHHFYRPHPPDWMALAIPKSISFSWPSTTRKLAGFKSECTMRSR